MKRHVGTLLSVLLAVMLIVMSFGSFALAEGTPAITPFDLKEVELAEGDEGYAQALYEAEYYNYRLLRNVPVAFEAESWDAYMTKGGRLENIDPKAIGEDELARILDAKQGREALVQVASVEDSAWFIWGDTMPMAEDASTLTFTCESEDNADFAPFLVPYLLEDQGAVKANIIIIAGGKYDARNNSSEGYPIARAFNDMGYNAFVLQRRVAPYSMQDVWMDVQRSVRYIRHRGAAEGFGGMDTICCLGFSGGSRSMLGAIVNLYGDIQPTIYDETYVPDEVDAENSDIDVALAIYGTTWDPDMTEYPGIVGDNENLPAMFIAVGADDKTCLPQDCLTLFASVQDRTLCELHVFSDVAHGFAAGVEGNNTMHWMPMADTFVDIAISKAAANKGIPEEFTKMQNLVVPFPFGDTEAVCAINDAGDRFYIEFTAFGDPQVLSGDLTDGVAKVTYDKSGFFSGDAQLIVDCIDPEAWRPVERPIDLPEDFVQKQAFTIGFPFGDTDAMAYANADASKIIVSFTAFGDPQLLGADLAADGAATVTMDKSGFFSGDIQLIADSLVADAWEPIA